MGELLAAQPGNVEVLGGGKRASTLRSRVRAIRKFLQWLHLAHDIRYPQTVEHCTEYLSVRLSEPCNWGALKSTHHSLVFLNDLTGTQVQDRPTSNQLCIVIYKELLAAALPGRPSKQAPRMYVTMLRALENVVTDAGLLPFVRVYAWWVLIQNWGTFRFSDHRCIDPSSVVITSAGFSAVLSRSKTIGTDKSIGSRPLTLAACCYISVPTWMQEGFTLLQQLALLPRDLSATVVGNKLVQGDHEGDAL